VAELSKAIARLMQERGRAQEQEERRESERAPGPAPPAPPAPPKLREILDQIRTKFAPGERSLAEALVRQLFDKAGADLLAEDELPELVGIALAAARFVLERKSSEPRVVVFDPDLTHDGWEVPRTVIQTLMRDRPFIVDTIRECLREAGCTVRRLLHPIFALDRDASGLVLSVNPLGSPGHRESLVLAEVERVPDPQALASLLAHHLAEVVLATDDYQAMRDKVAALAQELRTRPLPRPWNADVDEVAAFLEWLGHKNFVFLGYREYQFAGQGHERTAVVRRNSGLGILRHEDRSSFAAPRVLPEMLRRRLHEPPVQIISKTNSLSPIHRRVHMDYIGIKEIDATGVVGGERRLLGLFTSKAYVEEPTAVPLLRRKLAAILEAEGAVEESHDYKATVAAFNSIPRAELLATSVPELLAEIKGILAAEGGSEVKVLQRHDALGRGVFVVVILPRERFSEELHRRIETRLAQVLSATAVLEQRLVLDEADQARLHFYLATAAAAVLPEDLQAQVASLLRTWDDRLRDALREQFPREQAALLVQRYTTALSEEYKAATDVSAAVRDIQCLETLIATRTPQVDLTNENGTALTAASGAAQRFTAVKLYLADAELVLSDFLPVLENLGLKVFAEDALDIDLPEVGGVRIHTFLVQTRAGARLDVDDVSPRLKPALLMLHGRRIENDRLNSLILDAGLEWRHVDVLRTFVNHGLQIGTAASRNTLVHALVSSPRSTRLLWDYFAAKFDPRRSEPPATRTAQILPHIEQQFLTSLDAVPTLADDRILRALFGAIAAAVRTNFFSAAPHDALPAEAPAIAVKFECGRMPHLPRPRPLFEIYVHALHVEALHLRGGMVARGGIRLSDRPDDFRTEILDLMDTQMVKNAVIVPAGAKGGFVVPRRVDAPPTSGQVVAAYRTFIGALLDLTDNFVKGRVVPPPRVLLYDGADPYLVVAADKGTATFSDIANAIATQRQFWLGDAFASGGAHGYDHKKEGITARGAWECVRRHFREIGRDADREPISVIGIGDMSGDVFGNGLLLSRRFRLRAAFNHQHILIDPDPDPARSFAERERLFHLPRSSWSDYNPALISDGGGVFPRNAKKVALSATARSMLGIENDAPSGEDVIRAILRMEADLLWNGGIGTYVKAAEETNAAVGDSANDAVRINGAECRVRVVAEGGNLGFTQRGRIEHALHGGRINTDAIDNSGGVDMSDHEVNLKIVLAGPMESGQLSFAERNQLLTELTADVTRRVLAHNQRQARALSLDQLRSQMGLNLFRDLMTQLETDGQLDRQLDGLPDRETLRNRRSTLLGLTRPELAVLLARSKLALQRQLLGSTLPDEVFFERQLRSYFPDVINARFAQSVRSHRLRREIIAVEVANAVMDTMGAAFVSKVCRDTGSEATTVVRAWALAAAISGADELWTEIANVDPPLPLSAETRCWFALDAAIERATKWLIEMQPPEAPATELHGRLTAPARDLLALLPSCLPAPAREGLNATVEALAGEGTPRALAQRIAVLARLTEVFEIVHIAGDVEVPRNTVAEVYYRVEEIVDLDWLRQSLGDLPAEDRWERRAVEGLNEALGHVRRQLAHNILLCRQGGGQVDECLEKYVADRHETVAKLRASINDIKSARRATLAALLVIMRELGLLVGQKI
jgi:glutamate dehydrogenase